MTHSETIEITGPHENAVQNFIHEMRKQADEGRRYGVDINVRRVDTVETDEPTEFKSANE